MKKLPVWILINFVAQTSGMSLVILLMAPSHLLSLLPFLALLSLFTTGASMWVLYAWVKVNDIYFITKDTIISIHKD